MWQIVGHWSYTGNPTSSTRDAVRWLVGDTDDTEPLCSDEEIDYAVAQGITAHAAAALVCQAIATRFAREADTTINPPGGVSHTLNYSQRAAGYRTMAAQYRATTAETAAPYCGGISRTDKQTYEDDSDRISPQFVRDDFTHPDSQPATPEWQDLGD